MVEGFATIIGVLLGPSLQSADLDFAINTRDQFPLGVIQSQAHAKCITCRVKYAVDHNHFGFVLSADGGGGFDLGDLANLYVFEKLSGQKHLDMQRIDAGNLDNRGLRKYVFAGPNHASDDNPVDGRVNVTSCQLRGDAGFIQGGEPFFKFRLTQFKDRLLMLADG